MDDVRAVMDAAGSDRAVLLGESEGGPRPSYSRRCSRRRWRWQATLRKIAAEVDKKVGPVPPSSVRSHMNGNTPGLYERIVRGRYRLAKED